MTGRKLIAALACAAFTATTAAAQQQGQPQQQRQQQTDPQRIQQPAQGGEWVGEAGARGVDNLGLTSTQVRQLQRALADQGCQPGPIDGLLGPRTRQAIECVEQRHNLTEGDQNELLRVLNVGFMMPQREDRQQGRQGRQQQGIQPGQQGQQPQQGARRPGQGAAPQSQIRSGEDRRDTTRIENRRDTTRTHIHADTGRVPPPGQQQIRRDTARTTTGTVRPPPR